ncbi:MAG: hypothetical protein QOD75_535 [Blastocatellia bacterium]|jgi:hypothetical protein|nr:hypothetical protein [Blastocatellia bacterium]
MAEERTLGIARAHEVSDEEPTKEELQRRMEEARDSITNTVTEIKDTVVNQYQSVKETINETLDWREQFRKRPLAWSAGALGIGLWTGYCIAGAIKGERDGRDDRDDEVRRPIMKRVSAEPSPAARFANAPQETSSNAVGKTESTEPEGPGLIARFRETAAYDRLEREVSSLGSRFVEELSQTAHEVVLPALLVKLKELIGMDLSTKKQPQENRLLADNKSSSADREVYGARPVAAQSAAAAAATGRSYDVAQGKADRGSGGSALPRPSQA